jgi:hypothetical protein
MTLTSEQALAMNAVPKITPEERDRLISALAEGRKPDELAAEFGKAVGTIYNFKTRWKGEIDDLRRARTVQFSDVEGTRKAARVDRDWALSTTFMMLIQKHLESCYALNPETGEREFVEQLVDSKKMKDYASLVMAANKRVMIETGQQIAPLPPIGAVTESRRFAGADGAGGVDYGELVQKHQEWVADEPERERKAAVRQEWHWHETLQRYRSVVDDEMAREHVQRDRDRKSGMSPAEYHQAIWDRKLERKREKNYEDFERFCAKEVTAAFAEYGPDGVTLAEIAEGVKWSLPQDAETQAEVDAWFAGEFCARVVEVARGPL